MPNGMKTFLIYWMLQTAAMGITALLIPRLRVTSLLGPLLAALALAFLNQTVWDATLFFSIPTTLTKHSLFLLMGNAVVFWIMAKLVPGIEIDGILPALLAPIVFTVVSVVVFRYGREVDWEAVIKEAGKTVESTKEYLKDGEPKRILPEH